MKDNLKRALGLKKGGKMDRHTTVIKKINEIATFGMSSVKSQYHMQSSVEVHIPSEAGNSSIIPPTETFDDYDVDDNNNVDSSPLVDPSTDGKLLNVAGQAR